MARFLTFLFYLFIWNAEAKSLLNNDPEVVYFNTPGQSLKLVTEKSTPVFSTKKGNVSRKLGSLPAHTEVLLLGLTQTAYKIKGEAKHGTVTGWISPKNIADENGLRKKLQTFYAREMAVRALIKKKQVAIGMTMNEVQRSLGDPTKKESRVTKDGRSGKWEFIQAKEKKHYVTVQNPQTGQIFRRFSHTTLEETENITIEFENDIVTAITNKQDHTKGGNTRIILRPIIFGF